MAKFEVIETPIKDLIIIVPKVFRDDRGFFLEAWNQKEFDEIFSKFYGKKINFVQDNHSRSIKGVVRGLHYQEPHPQGKLVRAVRGKIFDVAVDLRRESPTFGKYYGVILSDDDMKMFYIPEGFAHGFVAISDVADVMYKTTDFYYPEYDKGIIWNDPTININWNLQEFGIEKVILSPKDSKLPYFKDVFGNI
jgi:dTDP-4-dehydrorhamnose 3,5-epimerase